MQKFIQNKIWLYVRGKQQFQSTTLLRFLRDISILKNAAQIANYLLVQPEKNKQTNEIDVNTGCNMGHQVNATQSHSNSNKFMFWLCYLNSTQIKVENKGKQAKGHKASVNAGFNLRIEQVEVRKWRLSQCQASGKEGNLNSIVNYKVWNGNLNHSVPKLNIGMTCNLWASLLRLVEKGTAD